MEPIERDSISQELGDGSKATKFTKKPSGGITEQLREESKRSFARKADRELPSDEAAVPLREPEKGVDEWEQFGVEDDRDSPSTEAALTSRGSEKGSERPLRDPEVEMPVPQHADFTESMFSSADADDLRTRANSTGREEPQESRESHGPGVPQFSGRDFKYDEGNENSSNSPSNVTRKDQVCYGSSLYREYNITVMLLPFALWSAQCLNCELMLSACVSFRSSYSTYLG